MKIIKRKIQNLIQEKLFKEKIIVIYGARQVGKTTLLKQLLKSHPEGSLYLNCDEPDIRRAFTDVSSTEIKEFLGNKRLVLLDEAQRVKNIGLSLKLIIDNFPDIQVVATGSSSFDLSNEIKEPLTGRTYEFLLYPFSVEELKSKYSHIEFSRILEKRIIYGMYPEITESEIDAEEKLRNLSQSYLFKDVLQYQNIRNADKLERLLRALALQIGGEVSYNELASLVSIDKKTVAAYMEILEKAFIIFRLGPFSRNLRNELKKLRKIYFVDTGIRNALINNFNPLELRQDVGPLWENYIICERLKFNRNNNFYKNIYFWRTQAKQEIDYLEESGGKLSGFEFKWKKKSFRKPAIFLETYKNSTIELITKDNFFDFVT